MSYPLAELPVSVQDLEINGPDAYGYSLFWSGWLAKMRRDSDCVVAAAAQHFPITWRWPRCSPRETTCSSSGRVTGRFSRCFLSWRETYSVSIAAPNCDFQIDPDEIREKINAEDDADCIDQSA